MFSHKELGLKAIKENNYKKPVEIDVILKKPSTCDNPPPKIMKRYQATPHLENDLIENNLT